MIALCTYRRAVMGCAAGLATLVFASVAACGSGDLVVGDDSADASSPPQPDAAPPRDGSTPAETDATIDVKVDAPPGSCAAAPGGPGMCLPMGTPCRQADTTGLTCPSSGGFCCLMACPELTQPAPSFCDGGPYAPTYDSKACITGFSCAPVSCASAGGMCVGLVPGACMGGHLGDANKYSCGGGLGVTCCLPGP